VSVAGVPVVLPLIEPVAATELLVVALPVALVL